MKLVSHFELATKTKTELHGLLRETFNTLAQSTPQSAERRNALASMENIKRALLMKL